MWNIKMRQDLRECLHIDDVDESEEERQSVFNSGHVGQEATLWQHLHRWGNKRQQKHFHS